MKKYLRKTAMILVSALIAQSILCSFSFADVSDSAESEALTVVEQKENIEEQQGSISSDHSEHGDFVQEDEPDPDKTDVDDTEEGAPTTDKTTEKIHQKIHLTADTVDPAAPSEEEPQEEVRNGWFEKNGKKYYFINGVKQTGMQKIDNSWYYFRSGGSMVTGWLTLDGDRYFFSLKTGKRLTGKEIIDGNVYFFRTKNGKMVRGWLKKNGKKYYHDPNNGKRMFGPKKIGKYRYYFNLKSGSMKKGWLKKKGKKYYYDKKGHKVFGVKKIGKKTYYFNKTTGAKIPKGKYYLYKRIWTKSSNTKYLIYVDKGGKWVNVFKGKRKHWNIIKRYRCTIGAASTPTPSGTYKVVCKVLHFGEAKGYTCWYATGFIGSTYLMHSVVCYRGSKTPSDGRLGVAVSHGCVRMHINNAKWIYDHIPGGTTVFIN